jgi:hypothetical protein
MPYFSLTRGLSARASEGSSRRGPAQGGLRGPAVRPNGVVGELWLVAPAHEELPGAVARPVVVQRPAEPLGEQAGRRLELVAAAAGGERGLDQIARDAAPDELLLDPVGTPSHQGAAILGEPLGEAGIVEDVGGLQLGDDLVDELGLDPLALEICPQVRDRPVAYRQGLAGEIERPAQLLLGRRQAAFSSGASAVSAGAGISATVPPSCPMPVTS